MMQLFRRLASRNAAILAGRVARATRSKGLALAVDDDQTPEPIAAVVTAPVDGLMAVAEHFDVDPRPTLLEQRSLADTYATGTPESIALAAESKALPARPYARGGWSLAGGVMVHRPCASGYRICAYCAPRLAGCAEGLTR